MSFLKTCFACFRAPSSQIEKKSDAMSLFEKGRQKTGGRISGTRNKFSKKFDDALLKDFEEHGEAAIKIARIERPTGYLKLIASRFPIEFQFTNFNSLIQD